MKTAPAPQKIQTRLPGGGYPIRSCSDEIMLREEGATPEGAEQRRLPVETVDFRRLWWRVLLL